MRSARNLNPADQEIARRSRIKRHKKQIVQKAVFDELVALVDPGQEPYKPIKGKSNVLMAVGIQGAGKTTTCTKVRSLWRISSCCFCKLRVGLGEADLTDFVGKLAARRALSTERVQDMSGLRGYLPSRSFRSAQTASLPTLHVFPLHQQPG
jgi:signal recognition particle GTPase